MNLEPLDQRLAMINAASKCAAAAHGRNRRRYGKEQADRILQSVSFVMVTIGHAPDARQARDQMEEIFKICAQIHAIHQGVI